MSNKFISNITFVKINYKVTIINFYWLIEIINLPIYAKPEDYLLSLGHGHNMTADFIINKSKLSSKQFKLQIPIVIGH